MDLRELDVLAGAEAGFELELQHPGDGSGLGLFITVLGRDSAKYRAAQNKLISAQMNRYAKQKRATMDREESERAAIDLLAAVTVRWSDGDKEFITLAGESLTCSEENARRVYTLFPWIFEQVDAAVADRANFLKGSSKGLSGTQK